MYLMICARGEAVNGDLAKIHVIDGVKTQGKQKGPTHCGWGP
jgi:hypothetical protein